MRYTRARSFSGAVRGPCLKGIKQAALQLVAPLASRIGFQARLRRIRGSQRALAAVLAEPKLLRAPRECGAGEAAEAARPGSAGRTARVRRGAKDETGGVDAEARVAGVLHARVCRKPPRDSERLSVRRHGAYREPPDSCCVSHAARTPSGLGVHARSGRAARDANGRPCRPSMPRGRTAQPPPGQRGWLRDGTRTTRTRRRRHVRPADRGNRPGAVCGLRAAGGPGHGDAVTGSAAGGASTRPSTRPSTRASTRRGAPRSATTAGVVEGLGHWLGAYSLTL